MKRHPSLAHLSRDHHGALILAQLLKKGAPAYKGLPTTDEGKAEYASNFYNAELIKHFEEEEEYLVRKLRGLNASLDKLGDEIIEEHTVLRKLFTSIQLANDLTAHLDKLGHALEQHIRKEEREFFPMIQELCSNELLTEIDQALSQKKINMKNDIESREDIKLLIDSFYSKVQADPTIGFIFNDIAKVNWEKHLPVMYDFWENTLFYTGGYTGNPMEIHTRLNKVIPLTAEHFQQWLELFTGTVDELFTGEKAQLAKQRAISIATLIRLNILKKNDGIGKLN